MDTSEDKKVRYFAYGSNMDPKQMKDRINEDFFSRKRGVLEGCRLVFNIYSQVRECGVANIVKDGSGMVEGVLYEITENGLKKLDDYEGHPDQYVRKVLKVECEGKKYRAQVYVANKDKTEDGLKPSKKYMEQLLKGQDILSKEYVEILNKVETKD